MDETQKIIKEFYNRKEYIEKAAKSSNSRNKFILSIAINFVGKFVLELGCGVGSLGSYFGEKYIGVDISLTALKQVSNRNRICADISCLPIKDNSIDMVFSICTLEHIPDPQKVLDECIRILKPGGLVLHDDAWHCCSRVGNPIYHKSLSSCSCREILLKLFWSVLSLKIVKGVLLFPQRIKREIQLIIKRNPKLNFKKLTPNLEQVYGGDADAFAAIDSHAVALYYIYHGFILIRPRSIFSRIMHRGTVICKKP